MYVQKLNLKYVDGCNQKCCKDDFKERQGNRQVGNDW